MDSLDNWIVRNANDIDLKVRIFENALLKDHGINDVDVSIERYLLHHFKYVNSNGLALHTDHIRCQELAINEIIERDLFMCHFLTRTPFLKIEVTNALILEIVRVLNSISVDMYFYDMGTVNEVTGIVCAISGLRAEKPFGYVLGTAAGKRDDATMSSFFEAIRSFANLDLNKTITIDDFNKKYGELNVRFEDHGVLCLDPSYAKEHLISLFTSSNSKAVEENLFCNWNIEPLSLVGTVLSGCPIHGARASSPHLQRLFVGGTEYRYINTNRIDRFSESYGVSQNINLAPHPLN